MQFIANSLTREYRISVNYIHHDIWVNIYRIYFKQLRLDVYFIGR